MLALCGRLRLLGVRANALPGLQTASRSLGMGSHVSDNDPEVLEKAKERHLKGKTKSKFPDEAPGWEEDLASDSEAVVKAERSKEKSIKEMQEDSVHCLEEEMKDEGSCADVATPGR